MRPSSERLASIASARAILMKRGVAFGRSTGRFLLCSRTGLWYLRGISGRNNPPDASRFAPELATSKGLYHFAQLCATAECSHGCMAHQERPSLVSPSGPSIREWPSHQSPGLSDHQGRSASSPIARTAPQSEHVDRRTGQSLQHISPRCSLTEVLRHVSAKANAVAVHVRPKLIEGCSMDVPHDSGGFVGDRAAGSQTRTKASSPHLPGWVILHPTLRRTPRVVA